VPPRSVRQEGSPGRCGLMASGTAIGRHEPLFIARRGVHHPPDGIAARTARQSSCSRSDIVHCHLPSDSQMLIEGPPHGGGAGPSPPAGIISVAPSLGARDRRARNRRQAVEAEAVGAPGTRTRGIDLLSSLASVIPTWAVVSRQIGLITARPRSPRLGCRRRARSDGSLPSTSGEAPGHCCCPSRTPCRPAAQPAMVELCLPSVRTTLRSRSMTDLMEGGQVRHVRLPRSKRGPGLPSGNGPGQLALVRAVRVVE
jgi:hypothetical protein